MIRWRGITFKLHPLFILVMLASVATGRFMELATLFLIVAVHELGHLAAALRFGWSVREVKLLPFGGVVEVEDAALVPAREELWVTVAGPIQHVWMAALGWLLGQVGWVDAAWADFFVRANATVALFNMLPVLPLDGGRLLQAWISLQQPYHRTLLWSARISLAASLLIVAGSLYPLLQGGLLQLNLLAIGLFLVASNWIYLRNVPYLFLRFLVHRAQRAERHFDSGAISRPIVLAEDRPLSAVVRLFMRDRYHLVYVMSRGKVASVVPEQPILDGFLGSMASKNADFRFFM